MVVSSLTGGSRDGTQDSTARSRAPRRCNRPDRERAARIGVRSRRDRRRERGQRAVEPTTVGAPTRRNHFRAHPARQNGSARVGSRHRVHDSRLAGPVEPVQVGIAGLSAKKASSGSAGVVPSSRSALSPRN